MTLVEVYWGRQGRGLGPELSTRSVRAQCDGQAHGFCGSFLSHFLALSVTPAALGSQKQRAAALHNKRIPYSVPETSKGPSIGVDVFI